jgi:hypothetical protein
MGIEMPDRLAQNLILYIRQNEGALSKRKREKEFSALTEAEVHALESIVQDAFEGFDGADRTGQD